MEGVIEEVKDFLGLAIKSIKEKNHYKFDWKSIFPFVYLHPTKALIEISIISAALPMILDLERLDRKLEKLYVAIDDKTNPEKITQKILRTMPNNVVEKARFVAAQELYNYGLSKGRIANLYDISAWDVHSLQIDKPLQITSSFKIKNNSLIVDSSVLKSTSLVGITTIFEKVIADNDVIITKDSRFDCINSALDSKYSFASIKLLPQIGNGSLKVKSVSGKSKLVHSFVLNNSVFVKNKAIDIITSLEAESISLCNKSKNSIFISDDYNVLEFLSKPQHYKSRVEKRLGFKINIDPSKLKCGFMKSSDLLIDAINKGALEKYKYANIDKLSNFNKKLAEGILYDLQKEGCPISDKEIKNLVRRIRG